MLPDRKSSNRLLGPLQLAIRKVLISSSRPDQSLLGTGATTGVNQIALMLCGGDPGEEAELDSRSLMR